MARRARGEGSIYFDRAKERWVGAVSLPSGRRRKVTGATQSEVARRLRALREEVESGVTGRGATLLTGPYLQQWLERSKPRLRPKSFATYAWAIERHLVPDLGKLRLHKLSPEVLEAYFARKRLRPRSVAYLRTVLRAALQDAVRLGLTGKNAVTGTRPPRIEDEEPPAVSPQLARRILEAVEGDAWEAAYVLALCCGLRRGEVLGLRWSAIDFDQATLEVQANLQYVAGRWALLPPKTRRSRRTVYLPRLAIEALRRRRLAQLRDEHEKPAFRNELGLVFTNGAGQPLHGERLTSRLQTLLTTHHLPRLTFHQLRHGYASLLLRLGVAPRVVMETLGHTNISTTMEIYTHVVPSLELEAAAKLDEVLQ